MGIRALVLFVPLLAASVLANDAVDRRVVQAQAIFERYVALGDAFDPAVVDLYADDALIRNRRTYPWGETKEITVPAPKYKELMRSIMPLAKLRGDRSSFSNVTYEIEGDGVRITATRFSELKRYESLISLLVKPSAAGEWLIAEELSESRP